MPIKTPNQVNTFNKFLKTLDVMEENNSKREKIENTSNFNIENDNFNYLDPNIYTSPKIILYDIFNNTVDFSNSIKINNLPNIEIQNKKEQNSEILPINEKIIIEKEIIINVEISSIDDILNLIEKYHCIDPYIKYNIDMKALHNIKEPLKHLNNMIGMKQLKNNIVDQILYFIQNLHNNTNDNNTEHNGDFLHTVIYGPPGTGKTEIAKIIGNIYSKLGILSKGIFKKVTRSDLIAGYLGQTALKTKDVIKETLGGVLFIDEAYSLGNPEKKDSFSKECIDTLCEALSDNKNDWMVIIAGYENELKESFFDYNPGLSSRFNWRFKTDNYTYLDLCKIFIHKINFIGWKLCDKITDDELQKWFKKNIDSFVYFGRDIEVLISKTKIAHSRRVFCFPINEKKKLIMEDLNKGYEMFINNDEIKARKEKQERERQIYNTLYG
jgi:SpoVK/Ycf46/Vps4 family AAA+-type ATPase